MENQDSYVFTYACLDGPCVVRFDSANEMLAYASGWQGVNGNFILIVSSRELRA